MTTPRKVLDHVELAQARTCQSRSHRLLKILRIDRPQEPAGKTRGELPHCHHLHAVGAIPGGFDPDHVPGQLGVNDDGAARCHSRPFPQANT